jgi:HAD superfamily hydrolase (TIGR01484 family)
MIDLIHLKENREKPTFILLDIEGTITNPRGDPGKGNTILKQKLRDLEAHDHTIIFCSGRDIKYINELKTRWVLSKQSPIIAENGCVVFDGINEHAAVPTAEFAPGAIRKRLLESNILEFAEFDPAKRYMITLYPKGFAAGAMVDQNQIFKILGSVTAQLSDVRLNITYSSASVDIMPDGVDKLHGLKALVSRSRSLPDQYQLDLTRAMYIGDSMNDLAIGKYVSSHGGLFCVPNNALNELKEAANYYAEREYDEGVIEIFEKYEL